MNVRNKQITYCIMVLFHAFLRHTSAIFVLKGTYNQQINLASASVSEDGLKKLVCWKKKQENEI